ncbi:MAG: penicillin-binding protein 1C [Gammaproteobacteria bacterium]|jgi:penicillin-binding protein 1C
MSLLLIAYWNCLPDPLFNDPLSRVLFSQKGQLLGARIAADEQWRFPQKTALPKKFVAALLEFEDKRFYDHFGVDPLAVARAFKQNLRAGEVVSGGSTLTMQVVRLLRKNPSRTYGEKIIEMMIATRLELSYSKDQILSLYAAHAPFGGNVVGLDAAAWRYFARPATDLSWAESAMLAVLPNNPAMIHPGRKRQQLTDKRDRLLDKLHRKGVISEIQLSLAKAESIPDKPQPLPQYAPHLLATLIKTQPRQTRFESTIDKSLQRYVTQLVETHSDNLSQQGTNNAAVLVIDNENFNVLAYVGNSHWSTNNHQGYAVDIVRRPRSTGSVLKPLLFATMLQHGELLPTTLVPDIPSHMNGYHPENYDHRYRGAVPAKVALARSLNIPAVRMLHAHGVRRFYDMLTNMGMTTLFRDADDYGLTLILGGSEGTLWDLTQMYANLAYIAKQKIQDSHATYRQARLVQGQSIQTDRSIDFQPGAAWLTLQALLDVNRPVGDNHWRNFASSQKIAWKTGTSYGLRDGWAIGSNRRYTVGVWVGNASGEGRAGLTGLGTAAPILFDVFNHLPATRWFTRPEALLTRVRVCRDDGLLNNGYCKTEPQWMPIEAGFQKVSHNYRRVHLDASGQWRVHSRCEPVNHMLHKNWFVLPPTQAYYYKQHHLNYYPLPPYRQDCIDPQINPRNNTRDQPLELVYPADSHTKIYIPVDLAGRKSQTVLEAMHKDPDATIYWHLNERYLGSTTTFHRMAVDIPPGQYKLTLVDQQGYRVTRKFQVLGK